MAVKFSDIQKKAIDTRNKNILVSAAAGSGKTAVLTERIVRLISSPENSIDRLLVVTFTNAAAAEMQKRTEDRIKELLSDPNTKNKDHLAMQLRLAGKADITTIDSFCGKLVRKFFYKTDIDPSFTAAPESSLTAIRQEAMDAVTDRAFALYEKGDSFYSPLYDLCEMFSTEGPLELELEDEILAVYNKLSSLPYPEKWLKETKRSLNFSTYEEYLSSDICKIIISSMELDLALSLIKEADRILTIFFDCSLLKPEKDIIAKAASENDPEMLHRLLLCIDFPTWRVPNKKKNPLLAEEAKAMRDKAKTIIKSALSSCELLGRESFELHKKALPCLNLFYALTKDFFREYAKKKSEKNMYEFSDIERAALYILTDEDGKETETATYLKAHYIEILTDEYQDTNPLQEEILKALSRCNNRFMVGDIKQSIYAFRNADPSIFTNKYNQYQNEEADDNLLIQLSENFRSTGRILDFVNLSFSKIMSPKLGGVEYESLNFPKSKKPDIDEPITDIYILNRTTTLPAPELNFDTNILQEAAEDAASAEAILIAKKIKDLLKEDKNLSFGDIVILVSRLEGVSDTLINTLESCGIPTVTDKPTDSTNFIENKIILSFLAAVDNPMSDIDLVSVLHSPIYRVSSEELCRIRMSCPDAHKPFYDAVTNYKDNNQDEITQKLDSFFEDMSYFRMRFRTEPVGAVISEIYDKTDYYNYLSLLTDSAKRRANLDKLLDLAADYDNSPYHNGLYGFLDYLNSIKEGREFKQAKIPTVQNNSVRLMTIHSSKGLQFPVVFLSQIQRQFRKADKKQRVLFDKNLGICMCCFDPDMRVFYNTAMSEACMIKYNREQIAENMRLYYVAMTRAEKRLVITACEKVLARKGIETYEDQLEALKTSLFKDNMSTEKIIPPGSIYASKSFLQVLMQALPPVEDHSVFNMQFLNWYELTGVLEDKGLKIYREDIGCKKEKSDFVYPYEALASLPTNLSVTEIKKERSEELYTLVYGKKDFIFKKPGFVKKAEDGLTPMERGTAYHTLLSALDYKNPPKDIGKFREELVNRGLLSEAEAAVIDNEKITAYINSPLAKRTASAVYYRKEHPFTMGLSVSDVYPDLETTDGAENEIILTHGVVDLFFEEEDGIVIVDFKTDKSDDIEALKNGYRPQLEIYKTALESALGKRVKELWLYLIYAEKAVQL